MSMSSLRVNFTNAVIDIYQQLYILCIYIYIKGIVNEKIHIRTFCIRMLFLRGVFQTREPINATVSSKKMKSSLYKNQSN